MSAKTFADKKEIWWRQKFAYRICWQKEDLLTTKIFWRILLTKRKSADKKLLLYKICLRKERHLALEKILKCLLKGQVINVTMNVSLKSFTNALDINVCGRWKLCSHLFENVIQQWVATFHQSEHETFLWQKSKLLTIEICSQNLLTKCESAYLRNLLTESADRICWQKNLLTKKSADKRNLLTESAADKNQICWQPKNRAGSTHQNLFQKLRITPAGPWLARTFLWSNLTPVYVLGPDLPAYS